MKTKPEKSSVTKFLYSVNPDQKQKDSLEITEMMRKISRSEPVMWGTSIVGLGRYHYKYKSGREGDWFKVGFSPRKQSISLYLTTGFKESQDLLNKLGKHKTGKACLYINKLEDVDKEVLQKLIKASIEYADKVYPNQKKPT